MAKIKVGTTFIFVASLIFGQKIRNSAIVSISYNVGIGLLSQSI